MGGTNQELILEIIVRTSCLGGSTHPSLSQGPAEFRSICDD
jgi:hypothetical protein